MLNFVKLFSDQIHWFSHFCYAFQFFYVLAIILVGEMILATIVFVIYTVPEARDNFLRSQPEKILYSAIERYMDDIEVKTWVDRIQSEVYLV